MAKNSIKQSKEMIRRFSIKIKDRTISGELHLPRKLPAGQKTFPAIIFSHGFYGTRYGTRGDMFMPIIRELLVRGMACIIFDYSGCGKSSYPYVKTSIKTEAEELDAVIDWTEKQKKLNPYKIGVVTHSLGGSVLLQRGPKSINSAVIIANPLNPVKRLRARFKKIGIYNPNGISSYESLSRKGEITKVGPRFWTDCAVFDSKKKLSMFHCPLLFVHGSKDENVPLAESRIQFAAANPPKQLCIISGASHNFKQRKYNQNLVAAVTNWFSKYFNE